MIVRNNGHFTKFIVAEIHKRTVFRLVFHSRPYFLCFANRVNVCGTPYLDGSLLWEAGLLLWWLMKGATNGRLSRTFESKPRDA